MLRAMLRAAQVWVMPICAVVGTQRSPYGFHGPCEGIVIRMYLHHVFSADECAPVKQALS